MTASLPLLALSFPEIDPVLIQIGPIAIRWYALAYIAGLFLGWRYCLRLGTRYSPAKLGPDFFDDLLLWATLGVVLGGRIGYVLFYKPMYFLTDPIQIVKVWEGGMSFHGGLLGVTLAIVLFARRRQVDMIAVGDVVAAATPIGLFFGRLANFINGELFGRVTDAPWGMVFPQGGPEPRHPSQLYEAVLEGLVLFVVLYVLVRLGGLRHRGMMIGIFLSGYGLSRFLVEFVREPDAHLGVLFQFVTMGQILSLPMILLGGFVIFWSLRAGRSDSAASAQHERAGSPSS
ncbi:MAG: prolipoprotein diacylglyceryl transferase [Kiloniellales bacterium]|nr:prolipoprotein diacylglyceryl transferase [Kiloniellales bacterium]